MVCAGVDEGSCRCGCDGILLFGQIVLLTYYAIDFLRPTSIEEFRMYKSSTQTKACGCYNSVARNQPDWQPHVRTHILLHGKHVLQSRPQPIKGATDGESRTCAGELGLQNISMIGAEAVAMLPKNWVARDFKGKF